MRADDSFNSLVSLHELTVGVDSNERRRGGDGVRARFDVNGTSGEPFSSCY